jgi:integrase
LLKANGEDVKTVQELLRHATVKMTLEVYTQAVTPAKRNAQSKGGWDAESGGAK